MTWPDHLLPLEEFEQLPEDNSRRYELVEVVAPGSGRTDRVYKRHQYAEAGIPAYWVVELDDPGTLAEGRLAEGAYKTHFQDSGVFYTGHPCELAVDLDALVRRRPPARDSRAITA